MLPGMQTTPGDSSRGERTAATSPPQPDLLSPEHAERVLPNVHDIHSQHHYSHPPPVPPKTSSSQLDTQSIASLSRRRGAPSRRHGSMTPRSFTPYAEAPLPSGIVYPSPPGRPKSRASHKTGEYLPTIGAYLDRSPLTRSFVLGTLSPISIPGGLTFSSFATSDG